MYENATFVDWLQSRRWYFERGEEIATVEPIWQYRVLDDEDGDFDLTIVRLTFASGATSAYFIPVAVANGEEAIDHPAFQRWLLRSLNDAGVTPSDLQWNRVGTGVPAGWQDLTGSLLTVEQSNSSIRYGDQVMIKVNRRLTVGPSPEAELIPVIARAVDRSFAPVGYGTLWQTSALESSTCLAVCTAYVPNLGDGWSFMLGLANQHLDAVIEEARTIGDVTARMHAGLISDPWRAEVAPEPIRSSDTARWTSSALSDLDQLVGELNRRQESFTQDANSLAELLPAAVPVLRERLSGLAGLAGTSQIRIHGDYHLGQLLRTAEGSWVVVDFDGEPNRPLSERRGKFSALRDVASMMRSFSYLRGTLERSTESARSRSEWIAWEDALRAAFMEAYASALQTGDVILIPDGEEALQDALSALELEKAIYECRYEMATRPDWLALPLSRLVRTR